MKSPGPESSKVREGLDSTTLDQFWKFVAERQNIWHKRVVEGLRPPWTNDTILRQYRFTNIYRELDPGTQYAIQSILEEDGSKTDKIFNIMIYRLIGRSESHQLIGFQTLDSYDADDVETQLKMRRDEEEKPVFTGAYMVSGYGGMGSRDKVENVSKIFDEIASNRQETVHRILTANQPSDAYSEIRSLPGFGNFLSYQILVDLLYPLDAYQGKSLLPFSLNEWSKPGPGAKKGLKVLKTENSQATNLEIMRWLYKSQNTEFERLDIDFKRIHGRDGEPMDISLANIQNCLCEFYKYHKILNEEGRARRRFRSTNHRPLTELREMYTNAPNLTLETL